MNTIAERIQYLVNKNNESAAHIMKELGISTNALSEWKKGKAKPSSDAIIKLSSYFGVSADYLLTGNETNFANMDSYFLSNDEKDLIDCYRKLLSIEQEEILEIIKLKLRIAKKITPAKSFDSTNSSTNDKIG